MTTSWLQNEPVPSYEGGLSKKWNSRLPEDWVHIKQCGSYVTFLINQLTSNILTSCTWRTAPANKQNAYMYADIQVTLDPLKPSGIEYLLFSLKSQHLLWQMPSVGGVVVDHLHAFLVGSVALLVARRTNDRKVVGSRPTKVVCIIVLTSNRMGWTARCGRPPLLLPSCSKLEFRLSALMDSDLAWVNGKSGRQSWRYADAFQHSIISEAIYHFTIFQIINISIPLGDIRKQFVCWNKMANSIMTLRWRYIMCLKKTIQFEMV